MKKFLITAFTLLISLSVMAQMANDRTLRLYYDGEVIFSRLVSQLDSLNFKVNTVEDKEEDKPVVPDITTCDKNYSQEGLYLGIIGFNNKLLFTYFLNVYLLLLLKFLSWFDHNI